MEKLCHPNITTDSVTGRIPLTTKETCLWF